MFLKWIGFEYLVWAQNFRMLGPEIKTVAESRAEICGFIGTAALVWLGLEPEPCRILVDTCQSSADRARPCTLDFQAERPL